MFSFLAPLLSAVLWWLAYPPLDQGWLAWVALAPWWVAILEAKSTPRAALVSTLGMLLFCAIGFSWIRHPTWAGYIAVCLILSSYGAIFALLVRWWIPRRSAVMMIGLPALWMGTEHLRSWLWTGFPWFHLAHTQHRYSWLIQCVDTIGTSGLTLLVAGGSGLVTYAWIRARHRSEMPESARRLAVGLMAMAGLAAGACGYGAWVIPRIEAATRPGPRVGIVQGNVAQSLRRHADEEYEEIFQRHRRATLALARETPPPRMIFWPEAMYPYPVGAVPWSEQLIADTAREAGTDLCIGSLTLEPAEPTDREYNSAYHFAADGSFRGRYDKIHLVPVGEYVPLRDIAPWIPGLIVRWSDLDHPPDLIAGKRPVLFSVDGVPFATLICFESLFPELSAAGVNSGARFLAHLSNDGWFEDSAELPQIEAITKFRAIEARVGIVRATNTGISSFIAPTGRIRRLESGGAEQNVAGTLSGDVPLGPCRSRFLETGDWIGWIGSIAVLGGLVAGTVRSAARRWRAKKT